MNIEQLHQRFLNHPILSTDSREIPPGCIFFALKGPNFDGNKYAADALTKGAVYSVVDDQTLPENDQFIVVDNVLETLQQLAAYHRKQLGITVLGITGTNGKTTTKELIVSVLQQKYQVSSTQGNLNNHIGVPLTLLSMTSKTEIGVVEMGANHPGEIAALCQIANPDLGLITNIGKAHLEGFGSFEGVIQTKSELYNYLRKKNAACFINQDNELLIRQAKGLEQLSYGTSDKAQLRGEVQESPYYLTIKALFPKGWLYLKSKLIGNYNFENVLAAARIGLHFKVDPLHIQKAIEHYSPSNNRSQLITQGSNKLIMDAYNANPTSMLASLKNFAQIKQAGKIVILGDMLELGEQSAAEHQKIIDFLESQDFEEILLVGKEFKQTETNQLKAEKFDHAELLCNYLYHQKPIENKIILIKGSRGIKLERILSLFQ
ncbi:UDP-N-acetylmuramoyl-tripeptide--D-alanyl-D-alanine ligase [Sunxiuqinia sp. sy24]|uniref:UDP-N-acetylmuramoyl-tripeptide--D-alanyl-D- alanine ligase n=1 Tax=Sunxiuqinia sp. sy24 TaxID=3461495 RepID=UPI0040466F52